MWRDADGSIVEERLDHAGQAAHGFGANVFIGIRSRDLAHDGDIVDARHRGAPDARLGVFAG